jgi:predicted nucleic acid-binding protein
MSRYLIDSDTLIYFLKGIPEVIERLTQIPPDALHTSRINATELLYGAYNAARIEKNLAIIEPFLAQFTLLEFDETAARYFAQEKARLKKLGAPIADMDLMIASIAIANECVLITNNVKHFERVLGLKIERVI